MENSDAMILLSKKISFNQGEAPAHEQALRIAVYDEYHALETYQAIIDIHGAKPPFTNFIQAEIRHYEALLVLCEKYGITPPINDIQVKAPQTIRECYELGVAAELENIYMYDTLLPYVADFEDIQDTFYRLQAASFNNHLPTLREHLEKLTKPNTTSLNQEEVMSKVNEISQMAQKIASGEATPDELTKMLNGVNISLIAGLLAGGVGGVVVNEILKKDEDR